MDNSKKTMKEYDTDELILLNPENCTFSRDEAGLFRAEIKDRLCVRQVRLKRLFPLRFPHTFISLHDGKKEVGIIENVKSFDAQTRGMVERELDFFYAVPCIKEILSIRSEYGFYRWQVITDRGECEFYVKGREKNVKPGPEGKISVTDINNCRYLVEDVEQLSPASRKRLEKAV